ncbi:uncharacterized protein SCHCODRAFT_02580161 [Schizophyllum commune H4-8]|nr:uncharacterized protein SCHCODRAFT_02580161 [Schizophyllum commune H4-8]KAI5890999.1 hypothetical protein SCHCODRAFT_02580161 [Schizophyllum commune H4-8]
MRLLGTDDSRVDHASRASPIVIWRQLDFLPPSPPPPRVEDSSIWAMAMHESADNAASDPQSARNPVANSTERRDNVVKQKAGERREENTVVIPRGGVGDDIAVNNESYEMSKSYADEKSHDFEGPPFFPENSSSRGTESFILVAQTTPVHRLPNELLSEIFEGFLASSLAEDPFLDNPVAMIAASIARVCRTWRQVAYRTPRLWTHLKLPFRPGRLDAYLQHYLVLSRGLPLHIQLANGSIPQLGPMSAYSSRWNTIDLHGRGSDFAESLPPISTPQLEGVNIRLSGCTPSDQTLSLAFLKDASKLSRLAVIASNESHLFTLTLPLASPIVSLKLDIAMLRLSCIIPPLRQCRKTLRELDLAISDPYSTVIGPDEVYRKPVSLRALKSLVLRRNSIDFLRYIKARHLEELVFELPAALISSNLLAFLVRSPSAAIHLRRLDLRYRDNDAETETLLQCFELMSNIEELRVVTASRADDVGKLFGDLECCEDEPPCYQG